MTLPGISITSPDDSRYSSDSSNSSMNTFPPPGLKKSSSNGEIKSPQEENFWTGRLTQSLGGTTIRKFKHFENVIKGVRLPRPCKGSHPISPTPKDSGHEDYIIETKRARSAETEKVLASGSILNIGGR